jgi:hypothetical protein
MDTIKELDRVARTGMILIEWHDDDSILGTVKNWHWCRNYEKILKPMGYDIKTIKITKDKWPDQSWVQHGLITIARHQ